ncbi:hypothetical protein BCR37DRAFT_388312 [Protomyces lactucae-debilis]|uniref:Uncharacterized protein n=1 Tax=Protomyces lactucae-debilis TaxID=2754530 RepID=A0A1Y2F7Q4_PROLT|nr:uncharacterized protein BCR37DRAFT_388312 [Protomyces lactucae-debilis]ORY79923.1 hypothetical protein BCR37DRAFT_388312 [Protomyces lactucae-debilis]
MMHWSLIILCFCGLVISSLQRPRPKPDKCFEYRITHQRPKDQPVGSSACKLTCVTMVIDTMDKAHLQAISDRAACGAGNYGLIGGVADRAQHTCSCQFHYGLVTKDKSSNCDKAVQAALLGAINNAIDSVFGRTAARTRDPLSTCPDRT